MNLGDRGLALAIAIFALVVVGALVAGAVFAGTQEHRVGENVRRTVQALGVAEGGAFEVMRTWAPEEIHHRPWFPADTVAVARATFGGGVYDGHIFKLNSNLYLLAVTGSETTGGSAARQRIGLLVRARPPELDVRASLTARGAVTLSGQAAVDGNVHAPPGWTECDTIADTARAGLRATDSSDVTGAAGRVRGSPPVLVDPTLGDTAAAAWGTAFWDQLVERASITLPAGTFSARPRVDREGRCDRADPLNWGDGGNGGDGGGRNPPGGCASYFPVIYVAGSATVAGGQGQGILLVDGDLQVHGGFQFFGITIVRGRLTALPDADSGAKLWGAVFARDVELDATQLGGGATVSYAKCAIIQALQASAGVAPLGSRAWVQLYDGS